MPRGPLSTLTALTFLLFISLSGCTGAEDIDAGVAAQNDPIVLLISIDGARHDYPELYNTPALDRIAEAGTRANHIEMVFPTKTFPTHYTLVTGLYPSNHGVVSNSMYDPEMDASFSLGDREQMANPEWWEDGEPIWVTAEQQDVKTATFFWPGSDVEIHGVRPSEYRDYDGSVPGEERVETILEWLDEPAEERPSFLTLYFSEVDSRGHSYGPESPEVAEAMANVNGYLNQLLDGLEERRLTDQVNLIVTTDHGMSETSQERVILLDDYIDVDDVHIVDYTPSLMIRPENEEQEWEIYDALSDAHPSMSIYMQEDLPEHLNFTDHPRIPSIIGLADDGWTITTRDFFEDDPGRVDGGAHGYDQTISSMHGIFYAQGPFFQEDHMTGPFQAINLYELMTHILGITPAENDGSLEDALESLEIEAQRAE